MWINRVVGHAVAQRAGERDRDGGRVEERAWAGRAPGRWVGLACLLCRWELCTVGSWYRGVREWSPLDTMSVPIYRREQQRTAQRSEAASVITRSALRQLPIAWVIKPRPF